MATSAKLLLKARPTPSQLADRLRPVDGAWPDGLELYLAAADLATHQVLDEIVERVAAAEVPAGFTWLIEGPVDSLDGRDFDITRDSDADRLVVERVAYIARGIGARAVNIHVISPSPDLSRLSLDWRAALLERSVPFLVHFVDMMQRAGAEATVENMPPVLRMRRSDFVFTPIGMASEDLRYLVQRVDGLKTLPDTSHTGLYLNARRAAQAVDGSDPGNGHAWSQPLARYLSQLPEEAPDLVGYMQSLPAVENAQVSNAAGLLGEGLAYGQGDFDLDPAIRWLGAHARHIVTETIEASHDDAVLMRDALRRMRMVLV